MAETMSHVERVLWRIAELGARCSQQEVAGGRGPMWAELEQTIAAFEAEFDAAHQAMEGAPARVRSLEGRLKVAQQQRDQERARVKEHFADAEAARRERDRERQRSKKAMAVAAEARAAVAEAKAAAAEAKAAAADTAARATAAEAAMDQVMAARDQAVAALDEAIATGERAVDARDQAVADRDGAVRALDEAKARIAELEAALTSARTSRHETVDTLAARAEGAVVVLPGVTLPDPSAGPVTPAPRVAWQPTWSEWASPEADQDVTDLTHVGDHDIRLDDSAGVEDGGVVRYLNVAATIAQLLPQDLAPLLVPGATVVRREGRLCATVAVSTGRLSGGADDQQAERLADAGFRVEWAAGAPLGV